MFYVPSFKIYGAVAGFYDYGPPGCAVKQNLTALWRKHFVLEENMLEARPWFACRACIPIPEDLFLGCCRPTWLACSMHCAHTECKPHPSAACSCGIRADVLLLHAECTAVLPFGTPNPAGVCYQSCAPAQQVECPSVTPEVVLKASGHVDRFTDFMVTDAVTHDCHRADHLLEAALEAKLEDAKAPPSAEERGVQACYKSD